MIITFVMVPIKNCLVMAWIGARQDLRHDCAASDSGRHVMAYSISLNCSGIVKISFTLWRQDEREGGEILCNKASKKAQSNDAQIIYFYMSSVLNLGISGDVILILERDEGNENYS
jgi:hypothetical protein